MRAGRQSRAPWSETTGLNIYSRSSNLSKHTANIKNGYQLATSRSRIGCVSSPAISLPTRNLCPNQRMRISPDGTNYALICVAIFYRIFGIDLTEIPGISSLTAHTLLTEVGPDLHRFQNASAFASWLGLCPDNRISGGKILSVKTRMVRNRLAVVLRMAAQSLHRSQSYLGQYFRRLRARLGIPAAITATDS